MSTHTERCFSRKSSGRYGHGIRLNQVNRISPSLERSGGVWRRVYNTLGVRSYIHALRLRYRARAFWPLCRNARPDPSYERTAILRSVRGQGLEGDLRAPGQDEIGD